MTTQRYGFITYIDAPDDATAKETYDTLANALVEQHNGGAFAENVTVSFGEITPNHARNQQIADMAMDDWAKEGEIEIDDGAIISEGEDNGAYVQAWVWVDFADTALDKTDPDSYEKENAA